MSTTKKVNVSDPVQLCELDELLNVVRILYSMDQFSEREARIIQRAVSEYRVILVERTEKK